MSERDANREALLPHAHRPIRAFLRQPHGAEEAFWDFVYGPTRAITIQTARAVADELVTTPATIGDLLAGWRPAALHTHPVECGREATQTETRQ